MAPRDSAADENNQMENMNEIERKYQIILAIKYAGYVKFRETNLLIKRTNTCTKEQLQPRFGCWEKIKKSSEFPSFKLPINSLPKSNLQNNNGVFGALVLTYLLFRRFKWDGSGSNPADN